MWDETNAQKNNFIFRDIHFPKDYDGIFSGAHMGTLNPFYKCMRRVYKSNNDYDSVDLTSIPQDYLQRCMYTMGCDFTTYCSGIPTTVDKKTRSEERRVGKECRSRWSPYH